MLGINPSWIVGKLYPSNHWCGRWVQELCKGDPHFAVHVTEQGSDYVHFLCIVRLTLLKRPVEDDEPACLVARRLRTTNRRRYIQTMCKGVPVRVITLLSRLGEQPLSKADYRRLLGLASEKNTYKCLSQCKNIKGPLLHWLEKLPDEYRLNKILGCIRISGDCRIICYIIDALECHKARLPDNNLAREMGQLDSVSQIMEWFIKKLSAVPFPDPPWEGNTWIHPVRNGNELKKVAKRFNNCIVGYDDSVNYDGSDFYYEEILSHQKYIYVSESGPAVIMLARDPIMGWQVDEINGINNQKPNPCQLRKILGTLAEAGYKSGDGGTLNDLLSRVTQEYIAQEAGYESGNGGTLDDLIYRDFED